MKFEFSKIQGFGNFRLSPFSISCGKWIHIRLMKKAVLVINDSTSEFCKGCIYRRKVKKQILDVDNIPFRILERQLCVKTGKTVMWEDRLWLLIKLFYERIIRCHCNC